MIVAFVAIAAHGQKCDPSFMFEKIMWPKPPFTLLKPYAIPVSAVKDVPFSVQYSYLLEAGSVYGFYLKQISKEIQPVDLTITNSDNEVMKLDVSKVSDTEMSLALTVLKSDSYNLNLHSPRSFDGCLVFYVSVNRLIEKLKEGRDLKLPVNQEFATRKTFPKDSVVKKFELRYNSSTRHAIELVEGQLYALQIPDDQSAKILNVHVGSGRTDASINTHIMPQEKGYILYIRSSESGVHTFDFLNQSEDKSAVAILMMAKERSGLPK